MQNIITENYIFERYSSVGSKIGNYFISFNKSGFFLSSGFYQREKIKNFTKVILYFDSRNTAVAFEFTSNDDTADAFALIHSNKGTTGGVYARSFVKTHNIGKPVFYGQRTPKKINYQGKELFVIDLSSRVEEHTHSDANKQNDPV